jgi:hypothetical protein
MNNLTTGLPGLDHAIAVLRANGIYVSWCVWGGYSVVDSNTQKRNDGQTTFEVIDLAKQYEQENANG